MENTEGKTQEPQQTEERTFTQAELNAIIQKRIGEVSAKYENFEELKAKGYEVLAVEQVEHSTKLQNFVPSKDKRYAVVLGNEVKGVHQEVVDACNGCLEIPQLGTKHSMNVSVTAGIIIWKFASQLLLL